MIEARVIKDQISDMNQDALFADGFEDALIGYVEQFNRILACYDRDKCLEIMMKRDGMTAEESEEYFCFNIIGSWVGENTPAFLTRAV
jgi:hypothetical protein